MLAGALVLAAAGSSACQPAPTVVGTTAVAKTSFVRGEKVTVTVTIPTKANTARATGTVSFTVDGAAPVAVALNATGRALYATTSLAVGAHKVSGSYSGDARYRSGSTGAVSVTVVRGKTTTSVTAPPEPVPAGTKAQITGQARLVTPAAGSLAGTMAFTASLGTAAPITAAVATNSTGSALWQPLLPAGAWNITASFRANASFEGSTSTAVAVHVAVPPHVVSLSAGSQHTCALESDGTARCWGNNAWGQLGDGTVVDSATPVTVKGLAGATSISAGERHTCASLADGTSRCWGGGEQGELGTGSTANSLTPVPVAGLVGVTSISAGQGYTCAIRAGGTAACWGANDMGRLGDGTETDRTLPVAVAGLDGATAIDLGWRSTCARLSDGTARCWGMNWSGELGSATPEPYSLTPVAVAGLVGATDTAVWADGACARLTDGTVRCWGSNGDGRLGNGGTEDSWSPVAVSGLTGATAVSAGFVGGSACALRTDATIRCWGSNHLGQLGDGTTTPARTPVTVVGITTATAVDVGPYHACALLADGSVRCWGFNWAGQLGDGSTVDAPVPVTVAGL